MGDHFHSMLGGVPRNLLVSLALSSISHAGFVRTGLARCLRHPWRFENASSEGQSYLLLCTKQTNRQTRLTQNAVKSDKEMTAGKEGSERLRDRGPGLGWAASG